MAHCTLSDAFRHYGVFIISFVPFFALSVRAFFFCLFALFPPFFPKKDTVSALPISPTPPLRSKPKENPLTPALPFSPFFFSPVSHEFLAVMVTVHTVFSPMNPLPSGPLNFFPPFFRLPWGHGCGISVIIYLCFLPPPLLFPPGFKASAPYRVNFVFGVFLPDFGAEVLSVCGNANSVARSFQSSSFPFLSIFFFLLASLFPSVFVRSHPPPSPEGRMIYCLRFILWAGDPCPIGTFIFSEILLDPSLPNFRFFLPVDILGFSFAINLNV